MVARWSGLATAGKIHSDNGIKSCIGERKVSLIRLARSKALRDSSPMCCNDLISSSESLTADDMPLSS